ncbi:GNAT family N-acetyltransferase [Roseobacter sp. GAI101]|uniref:GNAT family N-acetyltransferase n=1 Tax=Roseobacter sp. (strain GAI101) TaxID=391589 RepID=UPI0001871E3D|nr:N-acetyltransferase [Roseobacter sp. GAI101]EEB85676.1 acetyltransferase, gnat family [Roseobacter sp. GAI101]
MSAAFTLAKPEHLDRLIALVAAFHAEAGIQQTDEARRAGLAPLVDGIPHGIAYLIGPARAPIGYVIITFGWSVEFGGLDAIVDEIYVRPGVRGRGIASEALLALPNALSGGGVKAVHLEVDKSNEIAQKLYARAGFKPRDNYMFMTRKL